VYIHDAFLWLRCYVNSEIRVKFQNKWYVLATVSKSRQINYVKSWENVEYMGKDGNIDISAL